MGLKFSRLRWPEWLIGASSLLMLVSMFVLPWFQLTGSTPGPTPRFLVAISVNGWHGLTHAHWLILLTIVAAFAVVFFQARERAPALPITFTLVAGLLAALSVLWMIYRVLISPPGGREIGGWIALLAGAAIVDGSYWAFRVEGISEEDAPHDIPTVRLGERTPA